MLRGFAHTDRGIAFAGAGTIGTELKVEQHFASYADDGDTNVGLIRREALLTFMTLNHIGNINIQPLDISASATIAQWLKRRTAQC